MNLGLSTSSEEDPPEVGASRFQLLETSCCRDFPPFGSPRTLIGSQRSDNNFYKGDGGDDAGDASNDGDGEDPHKHRWARIDGC